MNATPCMPREKLKQYLAGWIDMTQSVEIEQHLSECQTCEQTIADLEGDPDTLLESVQHGSPRREASLSGDAVLMDAVTRAKRLMDREAVSATGSLQPAPSSLGVYELIRPLGRGGMGAVYLARHRTLGKQVAIKLLPDTLASRGEAAARFQREIRAAGKLNHQSIVSATDAGEEHGTHFLVMEYIDGMDLSHIARLVGPLKIADACELMRQVALGLSYAHAEGIIHRDVKPSNLILDEYGRAKILDFGLAQLCLWDEASAELTSVGQLMGTLDYMAPEQAERFGSVDYRADLYSLGATLFRLLCGRAPLAAAPNLSPLDKLRLLAQHNPPRLDTLRLDAPPELVQLVGALLGRDPESRPASAAHVAESLVPFTQDADLAGLLAQARTAASQSTDPSDVEDRAPGKFSVQLSSAMKTKQQQPVNKRWTAWLVAAAILAFLPVAAVLIVLETQKGQLVIHSEVGNVHVTVRRDGKPVRDLQLDTGATSTRLAADKYEIVLDSPSDGITIDNSTVVVKKGQTVVARIHSQEGAASKVGATGADKPGFVDRNLDSAPATDKDVSDRHGPAEPLYDGKPLSVWLVQLSRDRSPKAIGDSLLAIDAMTTPETSERIRESLIKVLPLLDGNLNITIGENARSSVDYQAFEILSKTTSARGYFELLAKLLNDAEPNWGRRIIIVGPTRSKAKTLSDMEPFLDWLLSNLLEAKDLDEGRRSWVEPAGRWCWTLSHWSSLPKSDTDRLIARAFPILAKCPHLSLDFWLVQPPEADWPPELRQLVVSRATRSIVEPETAPKHVTESCMILCTALASGWEFSGAGVNQIRNAVQTRLTGIAGDPTRMFSIVNVEQFYQLLVLPQSQLPGFQFNTRRGEGAYEVIELLDLAANLKTKQVEPFDVSALLKATETQYEKVAKVASMASRFPRFAMDWPSLDRAAGEFRGGGGPQNLNFANMDSFKPRDWLGYLIHRQAAEVAGITLQAPAENPDLESPNKKKR